MTYPECPAPCLRHSYPQDVPDVWISTFLDGSLFSVGQIGGAKVKQTEKSTITTTTTIITPPFRSKALQVSGPFLSLQVARAV